MNETFEIIPKQSVGPFRLGMTRAEIWSLHRCPITSFYKSPDCERRTDAFKLLGIHVAYDADDTAQNIEAHMRVQYNSVTFLLDGNRINDLTVGEVREICSLFESPLTDFEYGFEVPSLGLTVYSDHYEDDASNVDAVSIFVPRQAEGP